MEQQFETQERNIVVTPQAERHLSKTAGWVLFMAIANAIPLSAVVIVFVAFAAKYPIPLNYKNVLCGVLFLFPFLLDVAVTYNAFTYSILVKKAINCRDNSALDGAMANKRLFWKHLSLLMVVSMAFLIVVIVWLVWYFYHESLDIF